MSVQPSVLNMKFEVLVVGVTGSVYETFFLHLSVAFSASSNQTSKKSSSVSVSISENVMELSPSSAVKVLVCPFPCTVTSLLCPLETINSTVTLYFVWSQSIWSGVAVTLLMTGVKGALKSFVRLQVLVPSNSTCSVWFPPSPVRSVKEISAGLEV